MAATQIIAQYPGTCLTCEEPYAAGDTVNWQRGAGCWHTDCLPPLNLATYVKGHETRRALGLD